SAPLEARAGHSLRIDHGAEGPSRAEIPRAACRLAAFLRASSGGSAPEASSPVTEISWQEGSGLLARFAGGTWGRWGLPQDLEGEGERVARVRWELLQGWLRCHDVKDPQSEFLEFEKDQVVVKRGQPAASPKRGP